MVVWLIDLTISLGNSVELVNFKFLVFFYFSREFALIFLVEETNPDIELVVLRFLPEILVAS